MMFYPSSNFEFQSTNINPPNAFESSLHFVNTLPCPVSILLLPLPSCAYSLANDTSASQLQNSSFVPLLPEHDFFFRNIPSLSYLCSIEPTGSCSIDGKTLPHQTFTISTKSATVCLEYWQLLYLNQYWYYQRLHFMKYV
jgi:hypothetical protein